jgi:Leucine-rich repeat (LRR) protein
MATHLDGTTTRHLHSACIRELILSHNNIVVLRHNTFYRKGSRFSACVQRIDLSYKAIFYGDHSLWFSFQKLPELRRLEAQQQKINEIDEAVSVVRNKPDYPMQVPHDSGEWTVVFPPSISFINMSGAGHIGGFAPLRINVLNATNLTYLDASFNRLIGCYSVITGLESLEYLRMSGWDCRNFSETILDVFPRLRVLIMRRMAFSSQRIFQKGTRLLRNLRHLETLDMSENDLEQLPVDLTSRHSALRQLLLAENALTTFDLSLDRHDNLTLLDLSFNRFSVLPGPTRHMLDSLAARQPQRLQLRLQGNPLACTCATLDFVRWMRETQVQLDLDGDCLCVTDSGELSSTGQVAKEWRAVW